MLQSIGIVTPVTLSNFNDKDNSFDCVTDDGKTLSLALRFGNFDFLPQLIVKDGELCSYYDCDDWSENLHIELQSSVVERNNSRLCNYYCEFFCNRSLTFSGDYYITVNVYEPKPRNENYVRVLDSKQCIENYLLGLTFPCTAQDIYEKIMELYGFDSNIVASIESIQVLVEKILSKDKRGNVDKKRTMSAILIKYGKVYQYAINEDDVSYSIEKNGDWFYASPYACYSFSAATNRITVTIEADETEVCAINIKK